MRISDKENSPIVRNKMIGKLLHKVKNKQGISLAELLVTLIFCLLTFALVVTAMQAATRQLKKSTMQSESKMLCSSLTMSIEDVLRYAGVGTGNSGESAISGDPAGRDTEKPVSDIKFYSRSRGRGKNCYFDVTNDGHIVFMYPNPAAGSASDEKLSADMAPSSTYTQGMKAYLKLQWHNDDTDMSTYQSFTGTVTVTDADNNVLNTQSFAVTPVNINR